ncbi:hypothetical protein AAFX91_12650 [Bradyrhizobium sp. 31Argb]|uniref:hypothetical protein n=1 Tax=Bradyrhizobium sp. 31Argb TaxID=3141247 RepID=UPI003748B340
MKRGPAYVPDESARDPDARSKRAWSEVPEAIRKDVEQHVAAHLPGDVLEKLRDLHGRGLPISGDPAFFHFGGGLTVRNLCRERLAEDALATYGGFGADWDSCYVGVLATIAAVRQ